MIRLCCGLNVSKINWRSIKPVKEKAVWDLVETTFAAVIAVIRYLVFKIRHLLIMKQINQFFRMIRIEPTFNCLKLWHFLGPLLHAWSHDWTSTIVMICVYHSVMKVLIVFILSQGEISLFFVAKKVFCF